MQRAETLLRGGIAIGEVIELAKADGDREMLAGVELAVPLLDRPITIGNIVGDRCAMLTAT